jgi:hypothetical protein
MSKKTVKSLPTSCTAVVDGVLIHGEIVTWDVAAKTRISHTRMIDALAAAGLDTTVSRPMAARNAFARACRHLDEQRIIRRIDDSALTMRFQFTAETRTGDRLEYNCETVLILDKLTGKVVSEVPGHDELVNRAQAAIDEEIATRTSTDITDVVQRLCNRHADLFLIRSQGGCYFVPVAYVEFLAKIETFISAVGGNLRRFPVPVGSKHGDRSVSEAVNDGIEKAVAEHVEAIAKFDPDTQDGTLERMVARINETRFRMEAYREYLGEKATEVEASLTAARAELRKKIEEMSRTVSVPEPVKATPSVSYADVVNRVEEVEAHKAATA